jgi:predicted ATPase
VDISGSEGRSWSTALTAISIEDFKGISSRVTTSLKPVTLLLGPNSAGKSAVWQALQYAREVLERKGADVGRSQVGLKRSFVDAAS